MRPTKEDRNRMILLFMKKHSHLDFFKGELD